MSLRDSSCAVPVQTPDLSCLAVGGTAVGRIVDSPTLPKCNTDRQAEIQRQLGYHYVAIAYLQRHGADARHAAARSISAVEAEPDQAIGGVA